MLIFDTRKEGDLSASESGQDRPRQSRRSGPGRKAVSVPCKNNPPRLQKSLLPEP